MARMYPPCEPGIGRIRLVKELCRSAHESDGLVLWGTCDEEVAAPYQPFVEAFRWLASCVAPDTLAGLLGSIGGELAPLVPDLHQRVPGLEPRLNDDPDTERHHLFEAATGLGLAYLRTRAEKVLADPATG